MEYTTLNEADKVLLARDTLRAKETDHFRISISGEVGAAERLVGYEEQIEELKKTVAELEKAQEKEAKKAAK